eukprot:TRINITY_DN18318_c0_g1_i1.p2 TRINITY_DN18318_c0_g1~~TRINITY_DN18318_c0_g1_i1.p2  ORF type:complete len:400 (+),score=130.00 TRINITY_DN18318_c0_g1_i1:72-1271(+)
MTRAKNSPLLPSTAPLATVTAIATVCAQQAAAAAVTGPLPLSWNCAEQCNGAEAELSKLRAELEAARRELQQCRAAAAAGASAALKQPPPGSNAEARVRLLDAALDASRLSDGTVSPLGLVSFTVERSGDPTPLFGPVSDQHKHQTFYHTELATREIMRRVLRPACAADPAPLFVELGSNEGAHGMLAAQWGCRTIQVEPQPQCMVDLAFSVALARTRHTGRVINAFVSDKNYSLPVPWRQCHGTKQFRTTGVGNKYDDGEGWMKEGFTVPVSPSRPPKQVQSVRVDDIVDENVFFLKLDVEGAEVGALRSASRLLRQHVVSHLLIEFSPLHWRQFGQSREADIAAVADAIAAGQYRCFDISQISGYPSAGHEVQAGTRLYWHRYAWLYKDDVELWCKK